MSSPLNADYHAPRPAPSWQLSQQLRHAPEALDARSFTALSSGLGLGATRAPGSAPRTRRHARALQAVNAAALEPARAASRQAAALSGDATALQGPVASSAAVVPPRSPSLPMLAPGSAAGGAPRLGFERKLMAWSVDLVFVTASLGVAMAIATLVAAMRAKELRSWYRLQPIEWLGAVHPFMMLAAVYGVYVLYHVLFRTVVGHTLGESWTRATRANIGPRQRAVSQPRK